MAAKSNKPTKSVMISVDDQHVKKIDSVLQALGKAGLTDGQAMRSIGTIVGNVPAAKLAGLSRVAGVSSVEESAGYQIPPPQSDVQ
jgi:hypothetical protein